MGAPWIFHCCQISSTAVMLSNLSNMPDNGLYHRAMTHIDSHPLLASCLVWKAVCLKMKEWKKDRKKEQKYDVCCMHDLWGPQRKGVWRRRKRNRGGDSFKGERCWFFCSVQRSGRSGRREAQAQGKGSLVVHSSLSYPQPPPTLDIQRFLHPPDLCPAAARVSLWLPLMKPPAPSPADWVACVRFTSYSTRPCAPAEAQHIEWYTHIHTSHPSIWFVLFQQT